MFRAALEAIAFGIRHNLDFMAEAAPIVRCIAVGGGTESELLLQLVSDVTGRSQMLPSQTIGASYGNAFLAAVGGRHLEMADLSKWVDYQAEMRPQVDLDGLYGERFGEYLSLYDATKDLVHRLAARGYD